ncbi:MAG TPA: hypothetical protein VFH66_09895 [Mycobacteriales bacterium]|nr:hypothetical protein [Mycobacteriales bacterium]
MRTRTTAIAACVLSAALSACGSGSGGSVGQGSPPTASGTPSSKPTTYTSPPATLPVDPVDLSTAQPPWLPPAAIDQGKNSASYVTAAGLPYAEEMLSVHYHAHLDINADGKAVPVPPYIGFVANGTKALGLAPLHTHQQDGIIHIENSVPATFVLGQFFVEWGVRLTADCVGGLCGGKGKELAFFVNGKRYTGDPSRIVLTKHEEIAIEYGDTGKLPTPPSTYAFSSGE